MNRNPQLLNNLGWFDIPLVDARQRRLIVAIERGFSGERALATALTAWGQN